MLRLKPENRAIRSGGSNFTPKPASTACASISNVLLSMNCCSLISTLRSLPNWYRFTASVVHSLITRVSGTNTIRVMSVQVSRAAAQGGVQ